jgi:predicted aspartyl protease
MQLLMDDGSAMMVQASDNNNKLVTGITVVELPDKEGKRHATTILIDTGFTGYALMSHQFAEHLGYEFQPKAIQSYCTATGKMETGSSVTVADCRCYSYHSQERSL